MTCAAPNLRSFSQEDISSINLYDIFLKRIERIFQVAAVNKNDILILGAFGCGAFLNPPQLVAKAFRDAQEKYSSYFETIEYAIYCSEKDAQNFIEFSQVFGPEFKCEI